MPNNNHNICFCEHCCGHRVTDPVSGLLIHGHILGRNKLQEHHHLARIKDTARGTATARLTQGAVIVDDTDNASMEVGSHSLSQPKSRPSIPKTSPEGET